MRYPLVHIYDKSYFSVTYDILMAMINDMRVFIRTATQHELDQLMEFISEREGVLEDREMAELDDSIKLRHDEEIEYWSDED